MPGGIVVAIPTYRRPQALAFALTKVLPQVREMDGTVLVVDNDPGLSGRDVAEDFDVAYVVEPRPGIAAVRNRALDQCASERLLVFIDDDEIPGKGWLSALVAMHETSGAAAVAGRVITSFPLVVEPWVKASGAFVRPIRYDGTEMREAASNNLLLDLRQVRELGVRFDERFGMTGGSDSMFTGEITKRGGRIVWAQAAVVFEQEEAARFTRDWVLMRSFRFGNTAARVHVALGGSRVLAGARGAARVAGGSANWVAGALTASLPRRARATRVIYRGAGMFAGAVGYAYNEYGKRRIEGKK